jgi:hypothetical protein
MKSCIKPGRMEIDKLLSAFCIALCISFQAQAVSDSTTTVPFRNIAEATDAMVTRYGYVITLETPRYVYEGDLEDQPLQSRNDADRVAKGTARRLLLAKAVPLTLELPTASSIGTDAMSSVVSKLAHDAGSSDHGAHFRVIQEGNVFHVVPSEVKDVSGNWVTYTSPFDIPVSMPPIDRSVLDAVKAVFTPVADTAHAKVMLLVAPFRTLRDLRTKVGASNESARTVLTRILTSTTTRMTWRVFYDIPAGAYFVSVTVVPDKASAAPTPAIAR